MIAIAIGLGTAQAEVVSVPGDADSLESALAIAQDGDTIELAPGVYRERVLVYTAVSIVGIDGAETTRVNGDGEGDVITIYGAGASVSGITLDGNGHAGIAIEGGDATLSDLRLVGFGTVPDEDDNVGGVEVFSGVVTLRDVEFDASQGRGGCAVVAGQSTVVLERVTVIDTISFGNLAAIEVYGGSLTAEDLTISGVVATSAIHTVDATVLLERVNAQCNAVTGPVVSLFGPSLEVAALLVADNPSSPSLEIGATGTAVVRNSTLVGGGDAAASQELLVYSGEIDVRSSILVGSAVPVLAKGDYSKLVGRWNLFDDGSAIPPELELDAVTGDPLLVADGRECLTALVPQAGSPAIDRGNPDVDDRNGSRNDIGATGGPDGFIVDLDDDEALSDVDCDDTDPARFPGADDPPDDGIDQDCDGDGVLDGDGDGSPAGEDCDDADAWVYPGADEVWYDGVDQDCSGGEDNDADGDGFDGLPAGGEDCDDTDPAIRPGAEEDVDPVDRDCDGYGDPTGAFDAVGCSVAGRADGLLVLLGLAVLGRRRRRR